jgi:hypothetical protein
MVAVISPPTLHKALHAALTQDRKLDRGNPNPGNIGSDFGRLDIRFWSAVQAVNRHNAIRQQRLEELAVWRNAIAHQDFDPAKLGGKRTLVLAQVRRWRTACEAPARAFDAVMFAHLTRATGTEPDSW